MARGERNTVNEELFYATLAIRAPNLCLHSLCLRTCSLLVAECILTHRDREC